MSLLTQVSAAGLLNPDRIKRWSVQYFRRTQSKTIFGEDMTGTSMTVDGPRKSDTIVGAPILLINDLKDQSGMVVNYTMINPLFSDSAARLNYAKVRGEVREGSEKSGSKQFVRIPLAEAFWGVKEEDVKSGQKDIGMTNLMGEMTKLLSDNVIQYHDDDLIETFFTGHSRHLYTTVAKAVNAANEAQISTLSAAAADYGIPALPQEHPNTYVFYNNSLNRADAETGATFVDKVNAGLGKILSTDKPGLRLLNQISLEIKRRKIVGTQFVDRAYNRTLIRVIVDPIVMQQIREDFASNGGGVANVLTAAYQTRGDEHPLIAQGSIIWGNLLICEEERLLEAAFSNKNSFSADLQGAVAATGASLGIANGDRFVVWADRTVAKAGSAFYAGATATANELDQVANVLVLGGNSMIRVPGPVQNLIPRTTDDYQRIIGLGASHFFAHKRPDFTDSAGGSVYNQSSFRVCVYRG